MRNRKHKEYRLLAALTAMALPTFPATAQEHLAGDDAPDRIIVQDRHQINIFNDIHLKLYCGYAAERNPFGWAFGFSYIPEMRAAEFDALEQASSEGNVSTILNLGEKITVIYKNPHLPSPSLMAYVIEDSSHVTAYLCPEGTLHPLLPAVSDSCTKQDKFLRTAEATKKFVASITRQIGDATITCDRLNTPQKPIVTAPNVHPLTIPQVKEIRDAMVKNLQGSPTYQHHQYTRFSP